jgi:hypothetical protein
MIDLSLGYNEANTPPILKAIMPGIGDLKFAQCLRFASLGADTA